MQPGRGLEEAWAAVRTAARDAGRDPDTLGLEGHVRAHDGNLERVGDAVRRWGDAGADHVAINPLRSGATWPEGHRTVLVRAADRLR